MFIIKQLVKFEQMDRYKKEGENKFLNSKCRPTLWLGFEVLVGTLSPNPV